MSEQRRRPAWIKGEDSWTFTCLDCSTPSVWVAQVPPQGFRCAQCVCALFQVTYASLQRAMFDA